MAREFFDEERKERLDSVERKGISGQKKELILVGPSPQSDRALAKD